MNIRHVLLSALTILLGCLILFSSGCSNEYGQTRLLVFTKTEGYRHASIPFGVEAIRKLGKEHGLQVDYTEDASAFDEANLQRYAAVIFLSTSGDVFDHYQQNALKRYIQAGGGFVGIHAATTTEYNWPWYGNMIGAWFDDHPHIQQAMVEVVDASHPATDSLPARWQRTDEWYNYKYISEDVNVLLNLDETTYEGGKHGEEHPIAWYHEYEGGRVFYTGGGHTAKSFSEPLFLSHLWGGIRYVLGRNL